MMDIREIMRQAFNLGQNYWQEDNSECASQHRKAEEIIQEFEELSLAVSIDIHQARLEYDALLEALELALAELIEKSQKIEDEFYGGEKITAENLDNGDKYLAAIAAAKGE